jgi:hypothetical protein
MLKKRFSSPNERRRSGAALAVPAAANRRSFVQGRATRTNGRISSRMIGWVSRRNGITAAFVSSSLRIGSRSDWSDERRTGANSRTSASACSDARSEPGRRATDSEIAASSFASTSKTVRDEVTSRRSCCGWLPTSVIRRP